MNPRNIVVTILTLGVGIALGIWLGGEEGPAHRETSPSVYRCPMHPTVVSDRAASCPICGMDLVMDQSGGAGHDGGHEEEAGEVRIDPSTVQNMGVRTGVVERMPVSRTVRTMGRVDYDETRMTDVNTKVTGWVEGLFVDFTGQEVKKGQPLLKIYSPELVAAQEEYLTALDYVRRLEDGASSEALEGAKALLGAARQRLMYWDIAEAQIDDLEQTRKAKRTMTIHSPQEGVVVHRAVYDGAHIKAGEHLYRIADLSRVWVYADIYEYELPWIRKGQSAEVVLSYAPGRVFEGVVSYVYPFLESKTRTAKVRMIFDNPELELKPEMFATVRVRSEMVKEAAVVPVQAVIRSGERNVVILDLGKGRFAPREVKLGLEADDVYEVTHGLSGGERIVLSAQFLIDSESNLKAALQTMGAHHGAVGSKGHQH
ncbi:MAG: efflux RND transporter periplasmic adaptor subunit [Gemmatimonadetes bacterium]|nr:efflux RND transporter periplasmic adaptor subunit [Gemmatimonadota bacterium]MDE3256352.1 efflux RND transporter periplasmic adaptor subunit [Gemmatimonadota bacterium]